MVVEKIEEMCQRLMENKGWPHKKEEFDDLWNPIKDKLTNEEQLGLLRCIAEKDYVFKWLDLFGYLLPDYLSLEEDFIYFLEIVIEKIKNDMAQGPFIRGLIKSGERKPQEAIEFYSKMIETSNDLVLPYSGLILGGAAKKKFVDAFNTINWGIEKGGTIAMIAGLKALRVAFEVKGEVAPPPPAIIDVLNVMWALNEDLLRMEVIQAYFDFSKYYPEVCEQRLLKIVEDGGSNERYAITRRLWFENLQDQRIEIQILKICAEDNNPNVLESVATVLSQKGQAFLEDSLEMVRKMIQNRNVYPSPNLEYYVKKLCEKTPETCERTFQQWYDAAENDKAFQIRLKFFKERIGRFK